MSDANIIAGKAIAANLRADIGRRVALLKESHGVTPGLSVVLVEILDHQPEIGLGWLRLSGLLARRFVVVDLHDGGDLLVRTTQAAARTFPQVVTNIGSQFVVGHWLTSRV